MGCYKESLNLHNVDNDEETEEMTRSSSSCRQRKTKRASPSDSRKTSKSAKKRQESVSTANLSRFDKGSLA